MIYHTTDTNDNFISGSVPIPSKRVYNFWNNMDTNTAQDVFNYNVVDEYINDYANWIKADKLNKLSGLENFPWHSYSSGTTESFTNFTSRYGKRCFRVFKGEFMFQKLNARNNNCMWMHLDEGPVYDNDAVIISLPFSDFGDVHPRLNAVLEQCNEKDVPVLIDCAYMCIAKNIEFDFNQPCIDTVAFSLSKAFWGIDKLRLGIRFQREDRDDNLDISNKWKTLPLHSIAIGKKFLQEFKPNWLWKEYGEKYQQICDANNLTPTNSILHAIGGEEYNDWNRGTATNRVCVSNAIGDYKCL